MEKQTAIQMLGGSVKSAAKLLGVTQHAIYMWPKAGDIGKVRSNAVAVAHASLPKKRHKKVEVRV